MNKIVKVYGPIALVVVVVLAVVFRVPKARQFVIGS